MFQLNHRYTELAGKLGAIQFVFESKYSVIFFNLASYVAAANKGRHELGDLVLVAADQH